MGSEKFQPKQSLELATLDKIFTPLSEGHSKNLGAKISMIASEDAQHPATNLVDGDPKTFWQTVSGKQVQFPVSIVLELPKSTTITGCKLIQQDDATRQAREYVISVQEEQLTWVEAARGAFAEGEIVKNETFAKPIQSRFVKLEILSGFGRPDRIPAASIAEIEVMTQK